MNIFNQGEFVPYLIIQLMNIIISIGNLCNWQSSRKSDGLIRTYACIWMSICFSWFFRHIQDGSWGPWRYWPRLFFSSSEQILILNCSSKDIVHTFLDLLITYTQSSGSSANTSPSTPSSPSPHLSRDRQQQHHSHHYQQQQFAPYTYNTDQLIRLKIFMRQTEHVPG